jgi:hypothetical protein
MNDIVFSEVIKEKLHGENLTQVAKELGIPKTLLHEWVQARRQPSMKNMVHVKVLANYLDLTLDEILFGKVQPKKKTLTNVIFEDDGKKYQISISKI